MLVFVIPNSFICISYYCTLFTCMWFLSEVPVPQTITFSFNLMYTFVHIFLCMFAFKQTRRSKSGSTITQTAEAVLKVICFVIMSCRSPGFIIEAAFERPVYQCMHRQHTGCSQEHAASTAPFFTAVFGNEATGDAVTALNPVCNRGETTLSHKPFHWS